VQDGRAAVVDPGDAAPVLAHLDRERLTLSAILNTHHHGDHVGGNAKLLERAAVPVFGPAGEAIPGCTHPLREGDAIDVPGVNVRLSVLDVPGHTAGHIAYVQQGSDEPLLFCGDTLFSAGCGRLFEGTPQQMHGSLARLCSLPDETRVCCAHEYTLSNLRFAHAVEPTNDDVVRHRQWCEGERAAGRPTLPSRMARERRINPFLRCHVPGVIAAARAQGARDDSGPAVFAALRRWKDRFR